MKTRAWIGLALVGGTTYFMFLRSYLLHWGATEEERNRTLSGDRLISAPDIAATYGITIPASTEIVWRWLAQMGRAGTGFYAFDAMTNNGLPSTGVIRRDLTPLACGATLDNSWRVLQLDANHQLVLGGFALDGPLSTCEATSEYVLSSAGEGKTRLLLRVRYRGHHPAAFLIRWLVEPFLATLAIGHLIGLRTRAARSRSAEMSKEKSNGYHRMPVEG